MISVAPSILAADFSRLGELVGICQQAGADRIHIDVMDGHFVPNLSMGPVVVQGLRPVTDLPLEVHLMVERPADYITNFLDAGADTLIFHVEVLNNPLFLLQQIRAAGKKVGLAINPDTNIDVLIPYLSEIDLVTCMTVMPGFGGQPFLEHSIERIEQIHQLIIVHQPKCELEVDGGIDHERAMECVAAGANVLVAGTAIFRAEGGPAKAIAAMRNIGS